MIYFVHLLGRFHYTLLRITINGAVKMSTNFVTYDISMC
jgi:hypothetical protein